MRTNDRLKNPILGFIFITVGYHWFNGGNLYNVYPYRSTCTGLHMWMVTMDTISLGVITMHTGYHGHIVSEQAYQGT